MYVTFLEQLYILICMLGQLPRCLRERQFALGWSDIAVPGLFVPECTTDGKYENVQCHPSSGFCWCSDSDGHIYSGTKVRGKPDCSKLPGKTQRSYNNYKSKLSHMTNMIYWYERPLKSSLFTSFFSQTCPCKFQPSLLLLAS